MLSIRCFELERKQVNLTQWDALTWKRITTKESHRRQVDNSARKDVEHFKEGKGATSVT